MLESKRDRKLSLLSYTKHATLPSLAVLVVSWIIIYNIGIYNYNLKMGDPIVTGPIVDSSPTEGKRIAGYTIDQVAHPESPEMARRQIIELHQALLDTIHGPLSGVVMDNSGEIIRSRAAGFIISLYPAEEVDPLGPDGIDPKYRIYDGYRPRYSARQVDGLVSGIGGSLQPALTMEFFVNPQPVSSRTFRALSGPDSDTDSSSSDRTTPQEISVTFDDEDPYHNNHLILLVHPDGSTELRYPDSAGHFVIVSRSSSPSSGEAPTFEIGVEDKNGQDKGDSAILDAYDTVRWNYKQATSEEQNNAMLIDGYRAVSEMLFMTVQKLETLGQHHVVILGISGRHNSGNPNGMKPVVVEAKG